MKNPPAVLPAPVLEVIFDHTGRVADGIARIGDILPGQGHSIASHEEKHHGSRQCHRQQQAIDVLCCLVGHVTSPLRAVFPATAPGNLRRAFHILGSRPQEAGSHLRMA
jgi:hypothetical protein